ncbi:MAG: hypothetical protein US18_C0010G0008 [Parcubacteria group bacterium GW2011_GWB1_36_5]|nr:MAG: hypothetical protein US18_C0010G0008 [Parcubacteria group bacterium GW2011_GWB1_36_5]
MPQESTPFNPQSQESDIPPSQKKGMTKHEMEARLRALVVIEADKQAKKEALEEAAQAIKNAMEAGQVPGRDRGEPTGPIKERIVEPGRTPRSGTDERHKQKEGLKLQFKPDPNESAHLNLDVFSRTGSSLTNNQLQDKLGASGIVRLLYLLNPRKKEGKIDKEEVARVIRENAFVIGPALLEVQGATTAEDVIHEINLKNLLAKKFVDGDAGVEKLCELIERNVRFPGWPAVSKNWKKISILGSGREAILTPEYVMDKLGPALISSTAKIRNEVAEYEKKSEAVKAQTKKNKETEETQNEMLRRTAQTAKNIMTRVPTRMPLAGQIAKSKEAKTDKWRFAIQGNTVRFTLGEETINSKIAMWKGMESVVDPNGERLIVQGNVVRQPTETELEILSNMSVKGNRLRGGA